VPDHLGWEAMAGIREGLHAARIALAVGMHHVSVTMPTVRSITNPAIEGSWSPVGERCREGVPLGHWKTMTFIAGLRLSGMTGLWVLDGQMDGEAF
jgi:hypothetical protein